MRRKANVTVKRKGLGELQPIHMHRSPETRPQDEPYGHTRPGLTFLLVVNPSVRMEFIEPSPEVLKRCCVITLMTGKENFDIAKSPRHCETACKPLAELCRVLCRTLKAVVFNTCRIA